MSDEPRWLVMWKVGVVVALMGVPAMIGFFAGRQIEDANATLMPWRIVFAIIGVLVGGLAAWRTLTRRQT